MGAADSPSGVPKSRFLETGENAPEIRKSDDFYRYSRWHRDDRWSRRTASMDRYETERDRVLTQRIRNSFTKDRSLSKAARNVQVIADHGNVVLNGVVPSTREKVLLGDKAQRIAGVGDVSNRLDVFRRGEMRTGGSETYTDERRENWRSDKKARDDWRYEKRSKTERQEKWTEER